MAFSTHDQVPDSPTNVFATFNPLDRGTGTTNSTGSVLTDGSLKVTSGDNRYQNTRSTISAKSGKFYAEFLITQRTNFNPQVGIATTDFPIGSNEAGSTVNGWLMATGSIANGTTFHNSSQSSSYVSFSDNDILQVIVDLDNQELFFGRNGTILNSGNAIFTNLPADNLIAFCTLTNDDSSTSSAVANFGQDPTFGGATNLPTGAGDYDTDASGNSTGGSFAFQPPTGALALCTANLPDPAIDPAVDDLPEDYFKAVTYTGQTNVGAYNNGNVTVGFQPDLVWTKSRNDASSHNWIDSVRGTLKYIRSDGTGKENTYAGSITSFNTNGYSLGTGADFNTLNDTYVAWCWKAGGAPDLTSSPTKPFAKDDVQYETLSAANITGGTITPTAMSVNTKAGFSIIKYSATGIVATVPHGLGKVPEFVIVKQTNADGFQWMCYHVSLGATKGIKLQSSSGEFTDSNLWNNTTPTPSVVTLGAHGSDTNNTGGTNIMYTFTSIKGYSKFGSYVGNNSTDGPFVYCGFRPAFVIIKRYNASGYNWMIYDSSRNTYNPVNEKLYANSPTNTITASDLDIDFLSNGFKVRGNSLGLNSTGSFIYMAFAEQPFKYANAR
jgi:hypothetical protein